VNGEELLFAAPPWRGFHQQKSKCYANLSVSGEGIENDDVARQILSTVLKNQTAGIPWNASFEQEGGWHDTCFLPRQTIERQRNPKTIQKQP
jgi:hypothetical protein